MPPPLPEELLDLRHVGAAGDVFDALVVDADDRPSSDRLAMAIVDLDLPRRLLAGLVLLLRRLHLDVEDALLRRDDDFAHLGMNPAAVDGDRLDEEVGHVALD